MISPANLEKKNSSHSYIARSIIVYKQWWRKQFWVGGKQTHCESLTVFTLDIRSSPSRQSGLFDSTTIKIPLKSNDEYLQCLFTQISDWTEKTWETNFLNLQEKPLLPLKSSKSELTCLINSRTKSYKLNIWRTLLFFLSDVSLP